MDLGTVPAFSIICMAVAALVAIGVPIALLVLFRKKFEARISSFLIGAVTFVVMAMGLEQLMHTAVLSAAGSALTDRLWLYALYGGAAAALFEETGRLLAMKFVMKKHLDVSNALMYGAGHGGIEAILILGISGINNVAVSLMINAGTLPAALGALDPLTAETFLQQCAGLSTAPAWLFLMGALERMSAIALHICLSLLVYKGIRAGRKKYILMAYLFHFLVDAVTVLVSSALPVPVLELLVLVMVVLIAAYVLKIFRLERERS